MLFQEEKQKFKFSQFESMRHPCYFRKMRKLNNFYEFQLIYGRCRKQRGLEHGQVEALSVR